MKITLNGVVRSIFTSGLEFQRPGEIPDNNIYCSLQIILTEQDKPPRHVGDITLRQELVGDDVKIGQRIQLYWMKEQ